MTFAEFLRTYGFFIALTIFLIIAVIIVLFLLLPRLHTEEKPKPPTIAKDDFLALLGGEENITSHTLNGSRLSVVLVDKSLADVETLKTHGVDRVIVMEQKLVLLVNKEISQLFE